MHVYISHFFPQKCPQDTMTYALCNNLKLPPVIRYRRTPLAMRLLKLTDDNTDNFISRINKILLILSFETFISIIK